MSEKGDKFTSQYIKLVKPQCSDCVYRDDEALGRCLAFPHGIPAAILLNEVDHRKPYDGDHGIRFKAK